MLLIDKFLCLTVLVLLGFFRPDFLLIGVYVLIWPYLILTHRKSAFYHLVISSLIALVWVFIAREQYGYNQDMFFLFGLHSFPLFAWALGMFAVYLIYSFYEHRLPLTTSVQKALFFLALYTFLLIGVETLGYHVLNIQNLETATFVGLPLCDCMHAPRWMQLAYFILGPIYLGICTLIGLEHPYKNRNNQKNNKVK